MSDDRRSGQHSRRTDDVLDWQLEAIERDMAKIAGKIEMLEKTCNDDRMERRFIPRAELELRSERSRDWGLRLTMAVIAVGQIIEAVLLARGGGH